ncbi:MAG: hypothetical protein LBC12_07750 [Nitrososphaerota archaeon]|jgi:ABC-type multidrug transport system fused ATPase/permease subunit|nr:hypothetical protein [Nitrososphaerota archaeon]
MGQNHPTNDHNKGKWQRGDIFAISLQIVIPIIAIIVTVFTPMVTNSNPLTSDAKLAIIGLGLLAPIIINQYSLINGQNKNELYQQDNINKFKKLDEKISHTNPLLEKAFLSGNDRIIRFASRRMDEVNAVITEAVNGVRSGKLSPREYYNELEYFADLIITDKKINGKNFKGEIWAMTSFAPDEWIKDDGYEDAWTEKLKEMVTLGITTKRICIVPSDLIDIISKETFDANAANNIKQFPGFIKLLKDYYGADSVAAKNGIAKHYMLKDTINRTLADERGFFAIKMTDGALHILTGETVDEVGSLSAHVVFSDAEIENFRSLCQRFMTPNNALEKILKDKMKTNGFEKYITILGIVLP